MVTDSPLLRMTIDAAETRVRVGRESACYWQPRTTAKMYKEPTASQTVTDLVAASPLASDC